MSKTVEYPKATKLFVGEKLIGVIDHIEEVLFNHDLNEKLNDGIRVSEKSKEFKFPCPDLSFAPSYESVTAEFLDILFHKQKRLPRKLKKAYKRVKTNISGFTIELFGINVEPVLARPIKSRLEATIKEDKSIVTVVDYFEYNGKQRYRVQGKYTTERYESELEPYTEPKDITERIKTFEDACEWCTENGHHNIRREYDCIVTDTLILDEVSPDLIAYLKLRIITCALNEGWEPTFEDDEQYRYYPLFDVNMEFLRSAKGIYVGGATSYKLYFKTAKLAEYAATQFKDIYMDFCYKGKE